MYNDEVKGSPPQEVILWHANYFELKAGKAKKTQKETLNFPLTLKELKIEDLFQEGVITHRYL